MARVLSILLVLVLIGCGDEPGDTGPPSLDAAALDASAIPAADAAPADADAPSPLADASQDAGSQEPAIPGLSAGAHLGVFDGYELPSLAASSAVAARRNELAAAGSDVARVHLSFRDLAPDPGRVDLTAFETAIASLPSTTRHVFVLLETIDSEGFNDSMPLDLVSEATPYALRSGLSLDAPAVIARFADVLRALVATEQARKVVALSVGNEPDAYFDDVSPSSATGQAFTSSLTGFLAGARQALRAAGSTLPVAMTLRSALAKRSPGTLRTLLQASDVAVFNYYGQGDDFRLLANTQVELELEQLVALAEGKAVIVQELGCPAGRVGGVLGASDAAQSAFFASSIASMKRLPQLRMAFVFQLVDWSPELSASYGTAYTNAGFPELGKQVEESLATMGLLRYADGSARPAFEVVRAGITELAH